MNRDRLFSLSPHAAAQGAMEVIAGVQNLSPEEQVIGIACAFRFVAQVLSLDRSQLLHTVDRMVEDCRFRNVNTLAAVKAYINGELNR